MLVVVKLKALMLSLVWEGGQGLACLSEHLRLFTSTFGQTLKVLRKKQGLDEDWQEVLPLQRFCSGTTGLKC